MPPDRIILKCYQCGRQVYLPALGNHMKLEHGIRVSQEFLNEFYNARLRYKALKYQIFGNEESSDSDSDNDLSLSDSALDRIQLMSNNFQDSIEGDKINKAIKGEPPQVSDYFKSILSPDDIHLAFDPSKRYSPNGSSPKGSSPKRWDPIEPGNHGWLGSERVPKPKPVPKIKTPALPWNRSRATDQIFFAEITNQIYNDILEEIIETDLYDIAGHAIQDEYNFLKKKFTRIQEIIELKKQKQVLHALKLEILALEDGQIYTDEESKVMAAAEKALAQLNGQYIEIDYIDIGENKSFISNSSKHSEISEKLQELQKMYKEEEDRKLAKILEQEEMEKKAKMEQKMSKKDKKSKKSKNHEENSSKKSKKDSKSKKSKSKLKLPETKNEKQNKKDKSKISEKSKKGSDKSLKENSSKTSNRSKSKEKSKKNSDKQKIDKKSASKSKLKKGKKSKDKLPVPGAGSSDQSDRKLCCAIS